MKNWEEKPLFKKKGKRKIRMSKRHFLRVIFMTMFSLPVVAVADDVTPLSVDPNSKLIKAGALCDVNTLGASESGVIVPLYAKWKPKTYACDKGQYVKITENSVACATCPKDYYCPKFNIEGATHTYVPDESSFGMYKCDDTYTTNDTTGNFDVSACRKAIPCSEKNPLSEIDEHAAEGTTYVNNYTICSQPVDGVQDCSLSCDVEDLKCVWGYKPKHEGDVWSCELNSVHCDAGQYLKDGDMTCSVCPENSYCGGGDYEFADAGANVKGGQGIDTCVEGLKSPTGSTSVEDCGVKLFIDGEALYLRSKRVENGRPTLVVLKRIEGVENEKWYAMMTPVSAGGVARKVSNEEGAKKELHVKIGTVEYTIHTATQEDLENAGN